jgi:hypothetical protein
MDQFGPNDSGCLVTVERVNHHATVDYVYRIYMKGEGGSERILLARLINLEYAQLRVLWINDETLRIRYPRSVDALEKISADAPIRIGECEGVRIAVG